jgi:CcmD family protein
MTNFIAAYVIVWLAVVLYVTRLGTRQRRLRRSLEDLKSQLDSQPTQQRPPSVAA